MRAETLPLFGLEKQMGKEDLVEEFAKKIRDLYAENNRYNNAVKIITLWKCLMEVLDDPAFDKVMYVLTTVNHKSSDYCIRLALSTVPECITLTQIKALWPHLPKSRLAERAILFRRATELAKDKNELIKCMEEFGYL